MEKERTHKEKESGKGGVHILPTSENAVIRIVTELVWVRWRERKGSKRGRERQAERETDRESD